MGKRKSSRPAAGQGGPKDPPAAGAVFDTPEQFETLITSQGEGIALVDLSERFLYANPAAETIFGVTPGQLVGRDLAEFLDEAGLEKVTRENALRKAGRQSRYDLEILRPGGQRRWISVTAVPRMEAGELTGVFGIFRDVTERRRIEASLREGEETLRAIVESTADGILVVDADWQVIHTNQRLVEIWQLPEELREPDAGERLVMHAARLVQDPAAFLRRLREIAVSHDAVTDTVEFQDGRVLEVFTRPLRIGERTAGRVWSFRDITRLKGAEESARREYAKLSTVISGMDEGILFADAADRIVEVNESLCRLLHLERDVLNGQPLAAFGESPVIATLIEAAKRLRSAEQAGPIVEQQTLGGAEVMLRIQSIERRGAYDGVLLNVINVTELVRARLEAEQASVAKGEFLANMSHEIRTPLNGVIGITELALRHASDPELQEQLAMIKSSADSLMTLVDDILDFSKVEAGRVELTEEVFDLRELVSEAMEIPAVEAREAGLHFAVEIDDGVPRVLLGDPQRLRQVLTNLVGNSLKFTERGGVNIRVEPVGEASDRPWIRFQVSDTGIGIPPERHQVIFDAFAQADGSTTRRYGGTGLGLAISSRLVELMGGRIQLESVEGQGSSFWFDARFVRLDDGVLAPAPTDRSRADRRKADDTPPRHGLRVLLAEDNPINQRVALSMLQQRGHDVVVVGDGLAAVKAVSTTRFDAVLMDVQMPELDGLEATRIIRERERGGDGHLRIVAMTAHAMPGDRERCLKAGMDAYLAKPFRIRELRQALEGDQPEQIDSPPSDERASGSQVLNEDELRARTRGDRALVEELVVIFKASSEELVSKMRAELKAGNGEDFTRAAHSLKGAASMMAASEVQAAAYKVEMIGRHGRLAEAPAAIADLVAAIERLQPALQRLVEGG